MKLVVLGGGTAGWITALYMRKLLPSAEIDLIQSSKIGIIGVGEATTPNFINFLKFVDIDPQSIIASADATVKLGINFENWNGDNSNYMHPFIDHYKFSANGIKSDEALTLYIKQIINQKLNINDYTYCNKIAYSNKVDIDSVASALHFNTNLLSNFFQNIGISRNIKIIDGLFQSSVLDEHGKIVSIVLDGDRHINCDFIFDCSGFSRLLIGKQFNQIWESYETYLPMKKAIPFWLDSETVIKPYTTATAMKYGWIWQTPLQSRIGSGYVFDSDYITTDQALAEAEQHFKRKLEVRRIIDFSAGRYANAWVKNCCGIGLSTSFIEPLESTSIFATINQLTAFAYFINELNRCDEQSIKTYNIIVNSMMDNIRDFVYFHYMTKRKDSEFWKNFRKNNPPPESLLNRLELLRTGNTRHFDFENVGGFIEYSFLHVGYGLDFFDIKPNVDNLIVKPSLLQYKAIINEYANKRAIEHDAFIASCSTR